MSIVYKLSRIITGMWNARHAQHSERGGRPNYYNFRITSARSRADRPERRGEPGAAQDFVFDLDPRGREGFTTQVELPYGVSTQWGARF